MRTITRFLPWCLSGILICPISCALVAPHHRVDEGEFLVQFVESEFADLFDANQESLPIRENYWAREISDISDNERAVLLREAKAQSYSLKEALENCWQQTQEGQPILLSRQPNIPIRFLSSDSHRVVERAGIPTISISRPGFSDSGRIAVVRIAKSWNQMGASSFYVVYQWKEDRWGRSNMRLSWALSA